MRCRLNVASQRHVLCVFPAYTPSFGTFSHAYRLMHDVRAFMPPQGLLLIAAYMPPQWEVRFVDENIAQASGADLDWADMVLVSGMHIQAPQIRDIHRRVKAAGKVMALGGPSVSAAPEMYPEIEYLHIGELGDGTDALIAALDGGVAPPPAQLRFETKERLPLADFPIPAYHLIPLAALPACAALQFWSGCPYQCEFCDIPGTLRPATLVQDGGADQCRARCHNARRPAIRRSSISSTTISSATARRRAICCRTSSPGRSSTSIPCRFACEATLNIAKQTENHCG